MNLTRSVLLMPAAALAAAALAACGGGANTNTTAATGGGPSVQAAANGGYRFAACMRSHGVSGFPDPVVHSSPGSQSVAFHVTPALSAQPVFAAAQKACNSLIPGPKGNGPTAAQQQRRTQEFVAFAQCLRTHGYTHFPDPNAQGELSPQGIAAAGVNVHAPGFFNVAKGCLPALKGSVSVAQLQRAISRVPAPGAASPAG